MVLNTQNDLLINAAESETFTLAGRSLLKVEIVYDILSLDRRSSTSFWLRVDTPPVGAATERSADPTSPNFFTLPAGWNIESPPGFSNQRLVIPSRLLGEFLKERYIRPILSIMPNTNRLRQIKLQNSNGIEIDEELSRQASGGAAGFPLPAYRITRPIETLTLSRAYKYKCGDLLAGTSDLSAVSPDRTLSFAIYTLMSDLSGADRPTRRLIQGTVITSPVVLNEQMPALRDLTDALSASFSPSSVPNRVSLTPVFLQGGRYRPARVIQIEGLKRVAGTAIREVRRSP